MTDLKTPPTGARTGDVAPGQAEDRTDRRDWRPLLEGAAAFDLLRTLILVPSAALCEHMRLDWAAASPPTGAAPRIETLATLARSLPVRRPSGPLAFRADDRWDLVVARSLLHAAGWDPGAAKDLAPLLCRLTKNLLTAASVWPPATRGARWDALLPTLAPTARDDAVDAVERRLGRVAIEWARRSPTRLDPLWDWLDEDPSGLAELLGAPCRLIVIEAPSEVMAPLMSLADHPWVQAVAPRLGLVPERLDAHPVAPAPIDGQGRQVHVAEGPDDEILLAVDRVTAHVQARRGRVAVVGGDRAQTRRLASTLMAQGVAVRDLAGWRLSTTRGAAALMAAVRALHPKARADEVLAWLKDAPAAARADVDRLEQRLRRQGIAAWSTWCSSLGDAGAGDSHEGDARVRDLTARVEVWRSAWPRTAPLGQWLERLRAMLFEWGWWAAWQNDRAGRAIIERLGWAVDGAAVIDWPDASMSLADVLDWMAMALESGMLPIDTRAGEAQVEFVGLHDLAHPWSGLRYAALVALGCDAAGLPVSPDVTPGWSDAQHSALGLPGRADHEAARRAAWRGALGVGCVDVIWSRWAASGQPQEPSPLVTSWAGLAGIQTLGSGPRRALRPSRSHPLRAGHHSVTQADPGALNAPITASAYDVLRTCPYRYHVLHLLRLRRIDELEADADKRDFGNWLHDVLQRFHLALEQAGPIDRAARAALMQRCADEATRGLRLEPGAFLPFSVQWPRVAAAYLQWLADWEGQGWRFMGGEIDRRRRLEADVASPGATPVALDLVGRIDRIDRRTTDGWVQGVLIDYKTEARARTRARVKPASEDVQLPFYALLAAGERDAATSPPASRAGYLSISDSLRDAPCQWIETTDLDRRRVQLERALRADLQRLREGAPVQALGDLEDCELCEARGLCRRDDHA